MFSIDEKAAKELVRCGLLKKVIEGDALTPDEKAVMYWEQLVANIEEEVKKDRRKVRKVAKVEKVDVREKPVGT